MGRLEKGLIHVYTGNGKGKTTAAFGLAVRALGEGLRVLIVQFLKGKAPLTGEAALVKVMTKGARVIRFVNEKHPIFVPEEKFDENELRNQIEKDFSVTREIVMTGHYDLVILDEINNVINGGWLDVAEVKDLIRRRPENVELVLTGRNAHQDIIEMSDYVTEMKSIKHPSEKGVKAEEGIEFEEGK